MTTATTALERALTLTSDEVRAALAGTKTQARRVLRLSRHGDGHKTDLTGARPELRNAWPFLRLANGHELGPIRSPFGLPGDNLWVRESWRGNPVISFGGGGTCILLKYRADNATREYRGDFNLAPHAGEWRSPALMPRWAARLLLEVVDVHVERLQAITEEDAKAEGVTVTRLPLAGAHGTEVAHVGDWPTPLAGATARDAFAAAWDARHPNRPDHKWETNPWVFVATFRRAEETHS